MKKFKKFIACVGIATLSLGAVACSSSNATQTETVTKTGDEVIAKVGDSTILYKQFSDEMVYVEQMMMMYFGENYKEDEQAMAFYDSQKEMIVNYLIESELVVQNASDLGINITDEEVEAEVAKAKEQLGSEEAYKEGLAAQGLTEDEFKTYLKENLSITQTLEVVTKDITVTDEEVETFYNENKDAYTTGAGANMQHILVATEEEAKEVKSKYEAGTSFEDLAAEYGTDGTKDMGGDLGFIEYDSPSYDADFLAGAKTLAEGEVSEPVNTQFGWHLIKVTEVQSEPVVTPFEEIKTQIEADLLQQKQYEAFSNYIQELKDKTEIEIFEDQF